MNLLMRIVIVTLLGSMAIGLVACAQAPQPSPPPPSDASSAEEPETALLDSIDLPNGFRPEGIVAKDDMIYVGSIPTGAIYRASVSSGEGTLAVQPMEGRAAIGIKIDDQGRLFVAGGPTGKGFVYDSATGQSLAAYTFTTSKATFVNDVTLTADLSLIHI